jgi:hypothetical protein
MFLRLMKLTYDSKQSDTCTSVIVFFMEQIFAPDFDRFSPPMYLDKQMYLCGHSSVSRRQQHSMKPIPAT